MRGSSLQSTGRMISQKLDGHGTSCHPSYGFVLLMNNYQKPLPTCATGLPCGPSHRPSSLMIIELGPLVTATYQPTPYCSTCQQ